MLDLHISPFRYQMSWHWLEARLRVLLLCSRVRNRGFLGLLKSMRESTKL